MKRTLALAVAIILPLVVGCKSDPASSTTDTNGNDSNNQNTTQQYTGANGFVINGSGMNNVTFNADSAVGESGTLLFLTTSSAELYGTLAGQYVHITVSGSGQSATGTFPWALSGMTTGSAHIYVSQDYHDGYAFVAGNTVITKVGAVGETIDGSFSGTMRMEADTSKVFTINGRFSAPRRD